MDVKVKGHGSSKKHKKHKKHKKKKELKSSESDSSDKEMEWVEAPVSKSDSPKMKHDDWMDAESFVSTLTKEEMMSGSSRTRKREEMAQKREREEMIQKSRELNPHWKDNGSGLPQEEAEVESLRLPSTSVGDGGYGYLKKAYIRIQEQSQREGRSMEEVAVERWGSLDKLVSMIEEAESRMKHHSSNRHSSNRSREDRVDRSPPKSFKKPHHHDSSPSPERSFRFQKPKDYDRNRKKVGKYSSSDFKKSYSSHSDYTEKRDSHLIYPKKSTDAVRDDDFERKFASEPKRSGVPAWKKVKSNLEQEIEAHAHKDRGARKSPSPVSSFNPSERKTNSEEPMPIQSEDDLNKLAAKYLKADLMGDKALASKLKAQLDEAREAFKEGKIVSGIRGSARPQERVLLTKADSSGMQRPIQASREDAGFERRSGHKKTVNKYFDDGSKYSLKQMFEREKLTTADDNLEMFMEAAAEAKESTDDNETSGINRKASHKMSHGVQEEKDIGKAIHQHQKLSAALDRCEYCLDQPNMKRHLIVSIREQAYLCIPNYQSLTKGHCLIVPKRHVPSFLNLDEDEWAEVEELKSLLRNLFRPQQKTLLCLETSMNFGRYPHAILECIPVPQEDGDMAPLYFKKAILESEEEWAHNIKLVDLTKKGLRRSVPKNMPYFCVLFDPAVHAGYAHVIENEKSFPRNFGKEVIGGMLDIDYNHLYKNRREDPLKKSSEALEFTNFLEEFNASSS